LKVVAFLIEGIGMRRQPRPLAVNASLLIIDFVNGSLVATAKKNGRPSFDRFFGACTLFD
jgi:hypothetical protein